MSDFFQNGVIATLPRLGPGNLKQLEAHLTDCARKTPVALLLPALFSEFEGPAMKGILQKLSGVTYIQEVVVALDRAEEPQFRDLQGYLRKIFRGVRIVWINGPRMTRLHEHLMAEGFPLDMPGKGLSVWLAMGYIAALPEVEGVALHDCDITNYDRELLARLVFPIMSPQADFEFCKGYYARFDTKLYGRVTRLFVTPLIRALKRTLGNLKFLDYLDSFRYPLSGEFALHTRLAQSIRIAPDWGLEISTLGEVYQNTALSRIAQVELMDTYQHKHQVIDPEAPRTGLIRMAGDIARSLFRILTQDGIILSDSLFRTLLITYIREAREAIGKYSALAEINVLDYQRHDETSATEHFAQALRSAAEAFAADPMGTPLIPAWTRIQSALPGFTDRIREAVEADNAG